jgi:CheY-like chemotaxis protein/HPt (histidine-containing phosphotransfer) domain-containing protein
MLQGSELSSQTRTAAGDYSRWSFRPARVLIVDDGPENRELLKLVLGDTGLSVSEAENGSLAVEMAQSHAYELILMDMQMPVMDGYTATRHLRAGGLKTPIIALTANAMKGSEKAVMDAGCSGYLTKPINIDLLLQTLAGLLGGKRVEESPPGRAAVASRAGTVDSTTMPSAARSAESTGALVSRLAGNERLVPAVRRFAGRLREQLDALDVASKNQDYAQVADLAHWLKGAGGTVGYDAFTEPAARLEQSAKDGAAGDIEATLGELRGLASRIVVPGQEQSLNIAVP